MFAAIHFINLLVMAEVLLGEHLFARFLTHREHYRQRLLFSTICCLLAAFLFPVPESVASRLSGSAGLIPYGVLMYLSIFAISAAGLWCCYQEDLCSILFCGLTGYTVHQLASALHDLCSQLPLLAGRPDLAASPVYGVCIYLLTLAAAMGGCYAALSGSIRKTGRIRIDNQKMLGLSGLVLMVEVVLGLAGMLAEASGPRPDYQALLCIYNATSCVFILWLLFGLESFLYKTPSQHSVYSNWPISIRIQFRLPICSY